MHVTTNSKQPVKVNKSELYCSDLGETPEIINDIRNMWKFYMFNKYQLSERAGIIVIQ